jgi:hypothetical protein
VSGRITVGAPFGACPLSRCVVFTQFPNHQDVPAPLILRGNEFAGYGFALSAAPEGSYCGSSVAAILAPHTNTYNNDFLALSTAENGDPNLCNGVPVRITFANTATEVRIQFLGTSVTYMLRVYDQAGNEIAAVPQNAVFGGGVATVRYRASGRIIKSVTLGYTAAVTCLKEVQYG